LSGEELEENTVTHHKRMRQDMNGSVNSDHIGASNRLPKIHTNAKQHGGRDASMKKSTKYSKIGSPSSKISNNTYSKKTGKKKPLNMSSRKGSRNSGRMHSDDSRKNLTGDNHSLSEYQKHMKRQHHMIYEEDEDPSPRAIIRPHDVDLTKAGSLLKSKTKN
jgi:hypothetical protein